MRTTYYLIGFLLIGESVFYFSSCKSKQIKNNRISSQTRESDSPIIRKPIDSIYTDLRHLAFYAPGKQVRISSSADSNKVYGIIMDWDLGEGIATLISFEDGEASLYLSSGGGLIGGGQHENVKEAVLKFISLAQNYLNKTNRTDSIPLPNKGAINFYLLTSKGKFIAQENMSNIENETSNWLSFFEEGNKVITELRMVSDTK
jgi:hypothetical protein